MDTFIFSDSVFFWHNHEPESHSEFFKIDYEIQVLPAT